MHTHFEILRGIPERIDATPGQAARQGRRESGFSIHVQPDRCYVTDRGYAKFELFNQINAIGSSYICRARDNSTLKILRNRNLTVEDRDAGIRVDREVVPGAHTSNSKTIASDHPVRYIEIKVPLHIRTGSKGSHCDGRLRLVTNLMDVPEELIAEAEEETANGRAFGPTNYTAFPCPRPLAWAKQTTGPLARKHSA